MTVDHHQDHASPRFPRGLVLLLLTGILLMVFVCLSNRGENDTPTAAADLRAVETHARAARREHSRSRPSQASAEADLDINDTPAILNELQNAGSGMPESTRSLLRRWAKADGRAAAAWAEQLPAGPLRENALSSVAVEWASTDLNSTVEWARKLPDATEQQTLLLAAANEAVRTDPVEALRLAVEFPEGTEGDETIRRAAMEWASKDAAGAMDWAKTIPDEALRHIVLAAEMVAWSDSAPGPAAAFALENLPAGRLLDDTLVSIVQRWAQMSPHEAATWVGRFPEGVLRATAIENLVTQWQQTDADSARKWREANLKPPTPAAQLE